MRRKILITGGSSGIGLELAKRLSARHDIMVTGSRSHKAIGDALPPEIIYVQASQEKPESATKTIANALLKAGWVKLDNVVLNAGTGFATENALDEADKIRRTLDVNLVSTILIARALFPWLSKANGTLSIIGSVAHKGQGLFPAYAASKGGLHGFVRALRAEWVGRVTVQMLHPGPTNTDMHAKAGHDPGALRKIFVPPVPMAKMVEHAMAAKKSPMTLSFGRYYMGGIFLGRSL